MVTFIGVDRGREEEAQLAAVLHQPRAEPELAALADDLPPAAAHDRARDGAGKGTELESLGLRGVGGAVPQQHVRELVRHDAGKFVL